MELSNTELIQGCLENNKKAWDLFVDRFSKLIYWNIRKVFGAYGFSKREELVQDVFQEVFERLIEKEELKALKHAESIRKYLSVSACNTALNKIKGVGRLEKRLISEEAFEGISDDSRLPAVFANDTAALIESVLSELSSRERACIEFHYFNELTFKEIGAILNVSEDAASSVVRRAKEKIKIRLEQKDF